MTISYAQRADVLYIVIENTANPCVYTEMESGAICRIDEVTNRVVGVTIPDFSRLAGSGVEIPGLEGHITAANILHQL